MTFHAPALTPAHGAYALIGIAVIAFFVWIVGRMLSYREPAKDEDPIERQFPDAPFSRRNIDAEG
jgi:hypothetical protein